MKKNIFIFKRNSFRLVSYIKWITQLNNICIMFGVCVYQLTLLIYKYIYRYTQQLIIVWIISVPFIII